MKPRLILTTLVCGLGLCPAGLVAALYQPSWSGSPGSTMQVYQFTDADNPAPPDTLENSFGPANAVITLGQFGEGWQDPGERFTVPGEDGAWDLGKNGTMSVSVLFCPAGIGPYVVDVAVDALAYQAAVQLPAIGVAGTVVESSTWNTFASSDPPGAWYDVVWTGRVASATSDPIAISVTASANGAIVDTLAVYTLYSVIPEPLTASALVLAAGLLLATRRLRRSRPARHDPGA